MHRRKKSTAAISIQAISSGVRCDRSDFLPQHFRVVEDADAASIVNPQG